ncbi:hypothetical protein BaRGS_00028458, partial [Batillaria attramentaria]
SVTGFADKRKTREGKEVQRKEVLKSYNSGVEETKRVCDTRRVATASKRSGTKVESPELRIRNEVSVVCVYVGWD